MSKKIVPSPPDGNICVVARQYTRPSTVSRLVLVIEYDEIPEMADVEEAIDKANEVGAVVMARFETLNPLCLDLVR